MFPRHSSIVPFQRGIFQGFYNSVVLFVGMAGLRARCFEERSDCKLLCVNSGGCVEKELEPRLSYCSVIKQCNTFSNAFKVSILTQRVNKLLPGSDMSVFPSVSAKENSKLWERN